MFRPLYVFIVVLFIVSIFALIAYRQDGFDLKQASIFSTKDARSTVEMVEILIPSVAQILTERLAVSSMNQPLPSRGIGTRIILDEQAPHLNM